MKLHDLSPAAGSNDDKIRKGRGCGARKGEKCGLGNKGQKKRSQVPIYYEGGQTPIYRRFPKRGFTPPGGKVRPQIVNVKSLERFEANTEVTPELLKENGLIRDTEEVKLLGDGKLETTLTVSVHQVSEGARQKVESAGGEVELLPPRNKRS